MSLNSGKRWLTFDCYDTLVRYTESKFAAMTDLISAKGGTKDLVESAWSVFQSFSGLPLMHVRPGRSPWPS